MRFNKTWTLILLIPLVCTVGTLYLYMTDGISLASSALDQAHAPQGTDKAGPSKRQLQQPQTAGTEPSKQIASVTQHKQAKIHSTWKPDPEAVQNYREAQRRHAVVVPGALVLEDSPAGHCQLATGSWCGPYWTQPLLPPLPPPRGDKECADNCNNVGSCDYDTGRCRCSAGWTGPSCKVPYKRRCFNMGQDKRDKDLLSGGWVHTRCSGICDDDIGMCFCPPETKYGRRMPDNPKPGDKPIQIGRPLYWCNPNSTADGTPIKWTWNMHQYKDIFGDTGWCNNDHGLGRCGCTLDGFRGPSCDRIVTQFCPNQCSGHGECNLGYCKCYDGWYGHDCSRLKKGLTYPQPGTEKLPANLVSVVAPVPSAQDPQTRPFRKRPFIYVYELPPKYHSMMLQHRLEGGACINRFFDDQDQPTFIHYNAYSLETVFHELMLTSEHRTFDPEEADYFYMPLYVSCLADVVGKANIPFWPADEEGYGKWGDRAYRMSMMSLEAKRWVEKEFPYWNRSRGRDHIWVFTHDEAPCYMHQELWESVWLSHWGRVDFPHYSKSSYGADNYTSNREHWSLPKGWIGHTSGAHPCHDPSKHLIVPVFKQPIHYHDSIYLGQAPVERDILAFFRGDMGLTRHGCIYSRCIRQSLWKLYKDGDWRNKHKIWYGDHAETQGDYTQLLSRSKFCLVIPGDGWSARYEDSMTHGCVPVIIMDDTLGPFESLIDYPKFSIRLPEKDLAKLPEVLEAVTPERLKEMQANMALAWMRFRWNGLPLAEKSVLHSISENTGHKGSMQPHPGTQWAQTGDDDAFSTVIQWLYSRMPEVHKHRHR